MRQSERDDIEKKTKEWVESVLQLGTSHRRWNTPFLTIIKINNKLKTWRKSFKTRCKYVERMRTSNSCLISVTCPVNYLKGLARHAFVGEGGAVDCYVYVWCTGMKAVERRGWMDGWSLCRIGKTEHRLKGNESEVIRISSVIHRQYLCNSILQLMHTIVLPCDYGKKNCPLKIQLASLNRCVRLHLHALNYGDMTSSSVQRPLFTSIGHRVSTVISVTALCEPANG